MYKRREIIGDCTLYLGDCLDIMPTLEKVDAVVTDPPYGLGKILSGGSSSWGDTRNKNLSWDMERPNIDFILNLNISLIIWGGNYFNLPVSRCWLIWNKPEKNFSLGEAELAWTNFDKPIRTINSARNPDGKRVHPTQKPIEVMKWCIFQLPKDCTGVILDPYLGSGTTLVACAKMGRKGIGIEINEEYFDIACQRVEEAYKQQDMFGY